MGTKLDTQLAWQQLGDGPDVVLIHGLATSRAFWYPNLALALKDRYRVTLFDLKGHGYSEQPETGYSVTAMAEDLLQLFEEAGIRQAHVIGHSYGGAVALEFAVAHPERVLSLGVLDARIMRLHPTQRLSDYPHLSAFEDEIARADGRDWEQEPQIGFAFMEAMARLGASGYEATAREAYTPFGEGRGGRRAARQFVSLLDETTARKDFLEPGAEAAQIAALRMPVLLMYGAASRCMPSGRMLSQLLPDARYVVLPEAGHFFPISHADRVRGSVESLLQLGEPRGVLRFAT